MQPYLFPYIGYYQLVYAVDKFVFYDDVKFIKGGWINRNNILVQGKKQYFNVIMKGASPNKNINEIEIKLDFKKTLKTIKQSYSRAPYLDITYKLIDEVFQNASEDWRISQLAGLSVERISKHLDLNTDFYYSSISYGDSAMFNRVERIIDICKKTNEKTYINASGGKSLYRKQDFKKRGINLFFIKNNLEEYSQFSNPFISGLSIIDVLMFNDTERTREMIAAYELE